MTFQLDTSGEVPPDYNPVTFYRWSDLSPFTQGYIEAMFATSYDVLPGFLATADQPRKGYTKTVPVGFSDLAPETLARIIADCEKLATLYGFMSAEQGRLIWGTRGETVGASIYAETFHAMFPPLTFQLGDDGKVRFAGE